MELLYIGGVLLTFVWFVCIVVVIAFPFMMLFIALFQFVESALATRREE